MADKIKKQRHKIMELMNFSPKQLDAHEALKKFSRVLYGGAMGGGKSYWIRWELIYWLLEYAKRGHDGVEVGLFCEDYPTLKDRQISKISKTYPEWLGTFHADHKEHGKCFILKPEYRSGIIKYRNLDDPSKYQSAEFAIIAVDELTKNPKETFDDLINRLRWPGIEDTKFFAGTNPGGVGHAWVKKWWMDGEFEEEMLPQAKNFSYIQALAEDNPHLGKEYLLTLDGLPDDKRRAFRDGDWDVFKGQYFSEFRRNIHVVQPRDVSPFLKKFICLDYGYSKPSAVYWCYTDSDGVVYVYRELYVTQFTYENLMKEISRMTPEDEDISYIVADPSIWSKKGETELSGAELMEQTARDVTGKSIILTKGINDRLIGWGVVREYLKPFVRNGEKIAKLQITTACPNLIRTFPSLVYDEHRVEDVDTDGEDHGPDAIRYGLMSRPSKSPRAVSPISRLLDIDKIKLATNQIGKNNVIDLE